MTKRENHFVQLECKHIMYFKSIGTCPKAADLVSCFRCPLVNDHVVYKRVIYSPNVVTRRQIRHVGLSVVCNQEDKCDYYEVHYDNLKTAMKSAKHHNSDTKHSSFVVRNGKILIASFTIGFGTYQPEIPFQDNSRAFL